MIERLIVGSMATNCYIVGGMIIDPGDDAEYILSHLKEKPTMILATHGHFDHIMAAFAIQQAVNIPFFIHPDDIFLLGRMRSSAKHYLGLPYVDPPPKPSPIQDIQFFHTPGHTPGSICIQIDDDLIVGDTIFSDGALGRTDFSYSNKEDLTKSLKKILALPGTTKLYPGHGDETLIQKEKHYHNVL